MLRLNFCYPEAKSLQTTQPVHRVLEITLIQEKKSENEQASCSYTDSSPTGCLGTRYATLQKVQWKISFQVKHFNQKLFI